MLGGERRLLASCMLTAVVHRVHALLLCCCCYYGTATTAVVAVTIESKVIDANFPHEP